MSAMPIQPPGLNTSPLSTTFLGQSSSRNSRNHKQNNLHMQDLTSSSISTTPTSTTSSLICDPTLKQSTHRLPAPLSNGTKPTLSNTPEVSKAFERTTSRANPPTHGSEGWRRGEEGRNGGAGRISGLSSLKEQSTVRLSDARPPPGLSASPTLLSTEKTVAKPTSSAVTPAEGVANNTEKKIISLHEPPVIRRMAVPLLLNSASDMVIEEVLRSPLPSTHTTTTTNTTSISSSATGALTTTSSAVWRTDGTSVSQSPPHTHATPSSSVVRYNLHTMKNIGLTTNHHRLATPTETASQVTTKTSLGRGHCSPSDFPSPSSLSESVSHPSGALQLHLALLGSTNVSRLTKDEVSTLASSQNNPQPHPEGRSSDGLVHRSLRAEEGSSHPKEVNKQAVIPKGVFNSRSLTSPPPTITATSQLRLPLREMSTSPISTVLRVMDGTGSHIRHTSTSSAAPRPSLSSAIRTPKQEELTTTTTVVDWTTRDSPDAHLEEDDVQVLEQPKPSHTRRKEMNEELSAPVILLTIAGGVLEDIPLGSSLKRNLLSSSNKDEREIDGTAPSPLFNPHHKTTERSTVVQRNSLPENGMDFGATLPLPVYPSSEGSSRSHSPHSSSCTTPHRGGGSAGSSTRCPYHHHSSIQRRKSNASSQSTHHRVENNNRTNNKKESLATLRGERRYTSPVILETRNYVQACLTPTTTSGGGVESSATPTETTHLNMNGTTPYKAEGNATSSLKTLESLLTRSGSRRCSMTNTRRRYSSGIPRLQAQPRGPVAAVREGGSPVSISSTHGMGSVVSSLPSTSSEHSGCDVAGNRKKEEPWAHAKEPQQWDTDSANELRLSTHTAPPADATASFSSAVTSRNHTTGEKCSSPTEKRRMTAGGDGGEPPPHAPPSTTAMGEVSCREARGSERVERTRNESHSDSGSPPQMGCGSQRHSTVVFSTGSIGLSSQSVTVQDGSAAPSRRHRTACEGSEGREDTTLLVSLASSFGEELLLLQKRYSSTTTDEALGLLNSCSAMTTRRSNSTATTTGEPRHSSVSVEKDAEAGKDDEGEYFRKTSPSAQPRTGALEGEGCVKLQRDEPVAEQRHREEEPPSEKNSTESSCVGRNNPKPARVGAEPSDGTTRTTGEAMKYNRKGSTNVEEDYEIFTRTAPKELPLPLETKVHCEVPPHCTTRPLVPISPALSEGWRNSSLGHPSATTPSKGVKEKNIMQNVSGAPPTTHETHIEKDNKTEIQEENYSATDQRMPVPTRDLSENQGKRVGDAVEEEEEEILRRTFSPSSSSSKRISKDVDSWPSLLLLSTKNSMPHTSSSAPMDAKDECAAATATTTTIASVVAIPPLSAITYTINSDSSLTNNHKNNHNTLLKEEKNTAYPSGHVSSSCTPSSFPSSSPVSDISSTPSLDVNGIPIPTNNTHPSSPRKHIHTPSPISVLNNPNKDSQLKSSSSPQLNEQHYNNHHQNNEKKKEKVQLEESSPSRSSKNPQELFGLSRNPCDTVSTSTPISSLCLNRTTTTNTTTPLHLSPQSPPSFPTPSNHPTASSSSTSTMTNSTTSSSTKPDASTTSSDNPLHVTGNESPPLPPAKTSSASSNSVRAMLKRNSFSQGCYPWYLTVAIQSFQGESLALEVQEEPPISPVHDDIGLREDLASSLDIDVPLHGSTTVPTLASTAGVDVVPSFLSFTNPSAAQRGNQVNTLGGDEAPRPPTTPAPRSTKKGIPSPTGSSPSAHSSISHRIEHQTPTSAVLSVQDLKVSTGPPPHPHTPVALSSLSSSPFSSSHRPPSTTRRKLVLTTEAQPSPPLQESNNVLSVTGDCKEGGGSPAGPQHEVSALQQYVQLVNSPAFAQMSGNLLSRFSNVEFVPSDSGSSLASIATGGDTPASPSYCLKRSLQPMLLSVIAPSLEAVLERFNSSMVLVYGATQEMKQLGVIGTPTECGLLPHTIRLMMEGFLEQKKRHASDSRSSSNTNNNTAHTNSINNSRSSSIPSRNSSSSFTSTTEGHNTTPPFRFVRVEATFVAFDGAKVVDLLDVKNRDVELVLKLAPPPTPGEFERDSKEDDEISSPSESPSGSGDQSTANPLRRQSGSGLTETPPGPASSTTASPGSTSNSTRQQPAATTDAFVLYARAWPCECTNDAFSALDAGLDNLSAAERSVLQSESGSSLLFSLTAYTDSGRSATLHVLCLAEDLMVQSWFVSTVLARCQAIPEEQDQNWASIQNTPMPPALHHRAATMLVPALCFGNMFLSMLVCVYNSSAALNRLNRDLSLILNGYRMRTIPRVTPVCYHTSPRPLPHPWQERFTQDGKRYFFNAITQATVPEDPRLLLLRRHHERRSSSSRRRSGNTSSAGSSSGGNYHRAASRDAAAVAGGVHSIPLSAGDTDFSMQVLQDGKASGNGGGSNSHSLSQLSTTTRAEGSRHCSTCVPGSGSGPVSSVTDKTMTVFSGASGAGVSSPATAGGERTVTITVKISDEVTMDSEARAPNRLDIGIVVINPANVRRVVIPASNEAFQSALDPPPPRTPLGEDRTAPIPPPMHRKQKKRPMDRNRIPELQEEVSGISTLEKISARLLSHTDGALQLLEEGMMGDLMLGESGGSQAEEKPSPSLGASSASNLFEDSGSRRPSNGRKGTSSPSSSTSSFPVSASGRMKPSNPNAAPIPSDLQDLECLVDEFTHFFRRAKRWEAEVQRLRAEVRRGPQAQRPTTHHQYQTNATKCSSRPGGPGSPIVLLLPNSDCDAPPSTCFSAPVGGVPRGSRSGCDADAPPRRLSQSTHNHPALNNSTSVRRAHRAGSLSYAEPMRDASSSGGGDMRALLAAIEQHAPPGLRASLLRHVHRGAAEPDV